MRQPFPPRVALTSPARAGVALVLACLPALFSPLPASSADLNAYTIKGDVDAVEIVKESGAYLFTYLYVWADDPSQHLQPHLLRCNGNGGGTLGNCKYPSAFLNCTRTQSNSTDFYNPNMVTERYVCSGSPRRDVGECVNLLARLRPMDGYLYTFSEGGQPRQAQPLALDVVDVGYVTGCTSKP